MVLFVIWLFLTHIQRSCDLPDGQCLQKLVLFIDYLSSAYINGLWAALNFGFVKAEGGFRPRGLLGL